MEPEVLLVDEPISGLDDETKTILKNMLSGLDLSYILISHDLDFLFETADPIYTMKIGKIILGREIRIHQHIHAHPHGTHPHEHE